MDQKLPTSPSYINLHLTTKGKYYWDIKVNLPDESTPSDAANTLYEYDKQLRDKFPQNTAEMTFQGKSSFKDVDDEI